MKTVLLDTNFLLIPAQFRVDIISEIDRICVFRYNLAVLDRTIDELKAIMDEQKGKHKAAAKLGLDILKKNKIKILKTKEKTKHVDDIIVKIADKDKTLVATLDLGLKKRLARKGIPLIILRQKRYLALKD